MVTNMHRAASRTGRRGVDAADMPDQVCALLPAILLALMAAGCAGEPGESSVSVPRAATSASAQPPDATTGEPATEAELAADRMPAALSDFPLPGDVVFVAPPRHEFGRLIVGLNSEVDEDEVAALFDAELEARGYAIVHFVEGGVRQWQFVKDGRNGVVDLDQNQLATVININLMDGAAP